MKVLLREKDMDLISVIVPVYKVEKYIHRCVDSILAQTFTDFELILVDDGSPDNCGIICDEYALKDNRIHVIHKENGGLSDARNAGIDWAFENSNSEWLTFIDSDDWVHPNYLDLMIKAAMAHNSTMVVCGYEDKHVFEPYESINECEINIVDTEDFYVDYHTIATVAWGKIYKKFYFQQIRYPYGKLEEDEFVTYRLLFQNKTIVYVNKPMYFYFQNEEGIMQSGWSEQKLGILEAYDNQFYYFKTIKKRKAFLCSVNNYIWALWINYVGLQKSENRALKEQYFIIIKNKLKLCLKQRGINRSISQNEHLYKIAYPFMFKIYKYRKRIINRINRKS